MNSFLSQEYIGLLKTQKEKETTAKSSLTRYQDSVTTTSETTMQEPIRKTKKCNCKQSKCLKLYCECLSFGEFCDSSCGCIGCQNTHKDSYIRDYALSLILERNVSNESSNITISSSY